MEKQFNLSEKIEEWTKKVQNRISEKEHQELLELLKEFIRLLKEEVKGNALTDDEFLDRINVLAGYKLNKKED